MQVKQSVFGLYKGTVERVTAPRTASAFLEKGVLSVPEFVLAGDNLVAKFFFRKGGFPCFTDHKANSINVYSICV